MTTSMSPFIVGVAARTLAWAVHSEQGLVTVHALPWPSGATDRTTAATADAVAAVAAVAPAAPVMRAAAAATTAHTRA